MINVKSYLESLNINKNSNVCITSNILSLIKIDRDKSIVDSMISSCHTLINIQKS